MRAFRGVKPKLAVELAGWTKPAKAFLQKYRGELDVPYQVREYTPTEIRNIRLDLLDLPHGTKRPRKLPAIVAVRMPKGGTGKTTMAGNISVCLAMMGYKVLMIDGDPQASLSTMLGVDWATQPVTNISELMRRANSRTEPTNIQDAVVPMYQNGMLDLIPASIDMSGADTWINNTIGREQVFIRLLEKEIDFFSQYDVIIIDSAPSSSLLTTSLMVASPTILAVVMPEGQSLGAMKILDSDVDELNGHFGAGKYDIHVIVNRFNQAKKPHHAVLSEIHAQYARQLNDTIIRDFVGFLRETSDRDHLGPLLESEPNSVGARDIIDMTKSIIRRFNIKLVDGQVGGI